MCKNHDGACSYSPQPSSVSASEGADGVNAVPEASSSFLSMFQSSSFQLLDQTASGVCTLCKDDEAELDCELPCGHRFHYPCVAAWMEREMEDRRVFASKRCSRWKVQWIFIWALMLLTGLGVPLSAATSALISS